MPWTRDAGDGLRTGRTRRPATSRSTSCGSWPSGRNLTGDVARRSRRRGLLNADPFVKRAAADALGRHPSAARTSARCSPPGMPCRATTPTCSTSSGWPCATSSSPPRTGRGSTPAAPGGEGRPRDRRRLPRRADRRGRPPPARPHPPLAGAARLAREVRAARRPLRRQGDRRRPPGVREGGQARRPRPPGRPAQGDPAGDAGARGPARRDRAGPGPAASIGQADRRRLRRRCAGRDRPGRGTEARGRRRRRWRPWRAIARPPSLGAPP